MPSLRLSVGEPALVAEEIGSRGRVVGGTAGWDVLTGDDGSAEGVFTGEPEVLIREKY